MSATYKKCANGHYYSALLERCPYCKPSDVGNICNAHNISKDNLYYSIKEALFQHTEELCVSNDVDENAIRQGIRRVMRDCPEIFWFAHQYTYNPETHRLHLNYQFSKERRSFIQRSIDNVIEHDLCIGYVRTLSAYEQVAFRLIHADYFFDRHYLRGGDIYPRVIADYIEKADLFVLCWSANAEKSEYVAKELAQAMQRAYPIADVKSEDQLMIYPISISPKADLPVKLQKMYNFVEL